MSREPEAAKRYGNGRWERKQLWAIVATYRTRGESAEWVAVKLGVGVKLVKQIYRNMDGRF